MPPMSGDAASPVPKAAGAPEPRVAGLRGPRGAVRRKWASTAVPKTPRRATCGATATTSSRSPADPVHDRCRARSDAVPGPRAEPPHRPGQRAAGRRTAATAAEPPRADGGGAEVPTTATTDRTHRAVSDRAHRAVSDRAAASRGHDVRASPGDPSPGHRAPEEPSRCARPPAADPPGDDAAPGPDATDAPDPYRAAPDGSPASDARLRAAPVRRCEEQQADVRMRARPDGPGDGPEPGVAPAAA